MPQRPGKAMLFAALIWLVGFVWGSFVIMTPSLKATPPIPYVSTNPWISFPILVAWVPLTVWLSTAYLRSAADPVDEGRKLGVVFAGANVLLDLILLVLMFGAGFAYFTSLTVLAAYALLLMIPRMVGSARTGALVRAWRYTQRR